MRFFSIILFIVAFLALQILFGVFVSNYGPHMIFAELIFAFLIVIFKGKWFLKYNNKWFYIFSISMFFTIVGFLLLKTLAMASFVILLLPLSIYLAFKALENKTFIKNGIIVLLITFFGAYYVFPNYIQFYYTYIEKEDTKINQRFPDINLINKNKEKIIFDTDKIIVLDFWTTSCGVCFSEFPLYNNLALKYKNNDQIEFYSVNTPLKRDTFKKNIKIIEAYNYSFKNIYATSSEEIKEKLIIYTFPTIVIIKDSMIVYQGHPSYDKTVLIDNFEKIIDNLLK